MYIVKGYQMVDFSGFAVREFFEGFVETMTIVGNVHILDGHPIPSSQMEYCHQVDYRKTKLVSFRKETRGRHKIEHPALIDPMVEKIRLLADELILLAQMELGCMTRIGRQPDETKVDIFVEYCEFAVVKSHCRTNNLDMLIDGMECEYRTLLKELNTAPYLKDLLSAFYK